MAGDLNRVQEKGKGEDIKSLLSIGEEKKGQPTSLTPSAKGPYRGCGKKGGGRKDIFTVCLP